MKIQIKNVCSTALKSTSQETSTLLALPMLIGAILVMAPSLAQGVLPPKDVPTHPYLAPQTGMHFDSFNSSVTDQRMVADQSTQVVLVPGLGGSGKGGSLLPRMCLNFMADPNGRLMAFCSKPRTLGFNGFDFYVTLFKENTYEPVANYHFAQVPLKNLIIKDLPLGLAYFMMDHRGRMIVVNFNHEVLFLKASGDRLILDEVWDLKKSLNAVGTVAQVFPDYYGGYWLMGLGRSDREAGPSEPPLQPGFVAYVSNQGVLQDIKVLPGEIIENGMALDHEGVYVVSDHATYQFRFAGQITESYRIPYDRATIEKPGTISRFGSGTTPTLLGQDLIAITDNADDQVNLLVYDRRSEAPHAARLICKVPLFEKGRSANENSVVAYGNSILVQNWYGAPELFGSLSQMEPGVMRVDVADDRSGCQIIWYEKSLRSTATMRLATQTGLLYVTTQAQRSDQELYEMALVDYATGVITSRIPLGQGQAHRQLSGPVTVGYDGDVIQPAFAGFHVLRAL